MKERATAVAITTLAFDAAAICAVGGLTVLRGRCCPAYLTPGLLLQGRFAAVAVPDPNSVVYGGHEDLSVTDLAASSRIGNRLQGGLKALIRRHQFQLDLGEEVHLVLRPPVNLRMPFLASVPPHFGDRNPLRADADERRFDVL